MRPGQQKQRSRGRGNNGGGGNHNNNNRKGQNPLTRTYDSSGPDVKIRGTAQTIAEKYMALARDAMSSGDRVMAENYLQHAEHYNRIIAAAQAMMQERYQRDERAETNDRQDFLDREEDDIDLVSQESPQPEIAQPEAQSAEQQAETDQPSDQPSRDQRRDHRRQRGQQGRQPQVEAASEQQAGPIIDESTPQPVIEGTPAEVQLEEETSVQDGASGTASPRRRGAGRPRRTPRSKAGEGETSGDAPQGDKVEVPAE